jgi:hypothetical protein
VTSTPRPYVAARIAARQRLAKQGTCPKCRAAVLVGPDRDDVAHWATVNAEPIDAKWETLAHGRGLSTYDLEDGALWHREPWHRDRTDLPIHVWHVCR